MGNTRFPLKDSPPKPTEKKPLGTNNKKHITEKGNKIHWDKSKCWYIRPPFVSIDLVPTRQLSAEFRRVCWYFPYPLSTHPFSTNSRIDRIVP